MKVSVIRKYGKGDIIKSENKLYLDVGSGVIPVYEQKVSGTDSSITSNGKTYYYNSSGIKNSFTPNPKLQQDIRSQNILHNFLNGIRYTQNTNTTSTQQNTNLSQNTRSSQQTQQQNQQTQNLIPNSAMTDLYPRMFSTPQWKSNTTEQTIDPTNFRTSISNKYNPNNLLLNPPVLKQTNVPKIDKYTFKQFSSPNVTSQKKNWEDEFKRNVLDKLTVEQMQYLDANNITFGKDAKTLQEGLNEKFNTGLVVDNKWGNKSQAALDEVLKGLNTYKFDEKYLEPLEKEEKLESPKIDVVQIPRNYQLNRRDIRNWIREKLNLNPYNDFTAQQRKAMRLYANGDKNQNLSFLGNNFSVFKNEYYKKGGKLVSNDPIQRFKSKF